MVSETRCSGEAVVTQRPIVAPRSVRQPSSSAEACARVRENTDPGTGRQVVDIRPGLLHDTGSLNAGAHLSGR